MQGQIQIEPQPVTFKTDDGRELAGLFIKPEGKPRAACVVHGATGVPREMYIKFSRWMAAKKGVAMLVYDYRDFGASLKGPLSKATATMSDWGVKDQSAALDYLISQYPDSEIWTVGHSIGGLFLNTHKQSSKVRQAFAVASGPNNWRDNPLWYRPVILAMWWVLGPAATKLFGYFPGKYMFLGTNIPQGVYWQWRKWCLGPNFYQGEYGGVVPRREDLRNPENIRVIGISDDPAVPPTQAKKLGDYYNAAAEKVQYGEISPQKIGAKKIGHIDIFRERNKAAWPMIVNIS